MLSGDLLMMTRRNGIARPKFVDPAKANLLERARVLIDLFAAQLGRPRLELDGAIDELVGDEASQKLTRGLAKLLDDRSEWLVQAPADPVELRRRLFEVSASGDPVSTVPGVPGTRFRGDLLGALAEELGITAEAIDEALYADLPEAMLLHHCELPTPHELLTEYNLASARGALLRAGAMELTFRPRHPSELRALLRALAFHQLIFTAKLLPDGAVWLLLDGPASIFATSTRYGMELSKALAVIVGLGEWSLSAELREPGKPSAKVQLSDQDPLEAPRRLRGAWVSEEVNHLAAQLEAKTSGWELSREPDLLVLDGQTVVVPDLLLTERSSGRRVGVEVIGYWRRSSLERRLASLGKRAPHDLIVCVSKRLAADKEAPLEHPNLLWFTGVISAKSLLEKAAKLAR
jgi:predicted nuclease of restriction endonuclease-like RecB superfamily